ncbi:MAG: hypothetical protein WC341_17905, partial [Bacteroidales bacterium]
LTFINAKDSLEWEPGAALPDDRMETLEAFHNHGIRTWVSLEPTIDPVQSLQLIRATYKFVDLYKIGKLNYHPLSKIIDWKKYTEEAVRLVMSCGRDYIVKDDLAPFIPAGLPQISKQI